MASRLRRNADRQRLALPRATQVLHHPACLGLEGIHVASAHPLHDEAALPFDLAGGGSVLRIVPSPGFQKDLLAATPDERLLIVDCPDAPGWLVPADVVRGWMAHHVHNAALEDLLLAHPLYEHLTHVDERGHSRGGRIPLVHWEPGIPTRATILAPEFLPDDDEAPMVNRDRSQYADAVADLLAQLTRRFHLIDVQLTVAIDPSGI